jgi:hypothetical protein
MFWGRKRRQTRRDDWLAMADRLELQDASVVAERLRRWLNLGTVEVEPIYVLRRSGQPRLYLFDYRKERRGPTGAVLQTVTACLLRSETEVVPVSLRARRKRNAVLESLEASAIGGQPVVVPGAPSFSEQITVYAREPEAAAEILTPEIREVFERVLLKRCDEPALVVGERHLLVSCEGDTPAELEQLERLAGDLLKLYNLLSPDKG